MPKMIEALQTPGKRFENLKDYPFESHYVEVPGGLRMHYLDENLNGKQLIVLMHGEPSWSYLYRKMIPALTEAGFRVIVPDLIGFGKSDKLVRKADYTYQRHVEWVTRLLIEHLDLHDINIFVQDWGGLIGLRIVAEYQNRFKSVIAANTALPTGDETPSKAFKIWQERSQTMNPFPAGQIIQRGTVKDLSPTVIAAYDAPFPDESYKAGAIIFPNLVPTTPDDPASEENRQAWKALSQFDKPFLTLFSDSDPITGGYEKVFQQRIPGARNQPHTIIEDAGHFLQEEKPEEIAKLIISFLEKM